jgi:hypothetical protein
MSNARNLGNRATEIVSVRDYGARGDGVTDDTAAFLAALAAARTVFVPDGHYILSDTIDITNRRLYGTKRTASETYNSSTGGVMLEFVMASTATQAITFGGFFFLEKMTVKRSGANIRGPILQLSTVAGGERNSYLKDLLLFGGSSLIYNPNTNSQYLYSCLFENIELGNYSQYGWNVYGPGNSGNVWINIYSTSWLSYPSSKNSATAFMSLTGNWGDGFMSQINCEWVNLVDSCFLFNGFETLTIASVHVEGVELQSGSAIFNFLPAGLGSKYFISNVAIYTTTFLGNNVKLWQFSNDLNENMYIHCVGLRTRNNTTNGYVSYFAYRNGSITNETPTLKVEQYTTDGAFPSSYNYVPVSGTPTQPQIIQELNGVYSPTQVLIGGSNATSYSLGLNKNGPYVANIGSYNTSMVSIVNVNGTATGANAAACVMVVNKDATSSRSINAAGTLNASGADYAEYMLKSGDFTIGKGDICGINGQGLLTNVFSEAVTFAVKSTDPSYVGGDVWGAAAGPMPVPAERLESESDEEYKARCDAFMTTDLGYLKWAERLEAERQKVDRIAFAGQVPVNVDGAKPGDYIVPVDDNGLISGIAVGDPTFEQYRFSVGRVIAINPDGTAKIVVIIH